MSHPLPTVKIVSEVAPGGYMIINESDLTDEHELYSEPTEPPAAGADAVAALVKPKGTVKR